MSNLLQSALAELKLPGSRGQLFVPNAQRDIFLVTYPRSGTTWLSCIAAELMFGISPKNLSQINSLVPDIHAMPKRSTVPSSNQYLLKSHLPLTGQPPYGKYRRVIYLIRDPRDVMLSYHRFEVAQSGYKGDLRAFSKDWVSGRIWPCSWQEHVNTWLGPRAEQPPFELATLRYEDFVTSPAEQVKKLATILGIQTTEKRIAEIISDTSADMMRTRERLGNAGAKPSLQFIGRATAGGWKDTISGNDTEAIDILEKHAGATILEHGYQLSKTGWAHL